MNLYYCSYYLWVVIIFVLSPVYCSLTYVSPTSGLPINIAIFSSLLYREQFNVTNMALVNLQADIAVFNYCTLDAFTVKGILPLLTLHKVKRNQEFAVLFDRDLVRNECPFSFDLLHDRFELFWQQRTIKYIQNTGASMFIVDFNTKYSIVKFTTIDGLTLNQDPDTGLYTSGSVDNEAITIIGANIYNYDYAVLVQDVKQALQQNSSLIITTAWEDLNHLDPLRYGGEGNTFRILSDILLFLAVINVAYGCNILVRVASSMTREDGSKRSMIQERLIVIPEIISALDRVILAIDPGSVFGIVNVEIYRVIFTFHLTIGLVASFVIIFLWLDFILSIKSVFAHKYRSSLFRKDNFRTGVLALLLLIVVSDVAVNIFGSFGIFGLVMNLIVEVPFIILLIFICVASLWIAFDLFLIVRKQSTTVDVNVELVTGSNVQLAPSSTGTERSKVLNKSDGTGVNSGLNGPSSGKIGKQILNAKLMLKVKQTGILLVISAICDIFAAVFGLIYASNVLYSDPTLYVLITTLVLLFTQITSICQLRIVNIFLRSV